MLHYCIVARKNKQFFYTDLVNVMIYESPRVDNVFKMRPSTTGTSVTVNIADPESVADWKRPKVGRIRSLRFYATERFDIT